MKTGQQFVIRFGASLFAISCLSVLLVAPPASADVFFYKDADGIFHFSNVRTPNSQPFITDHPLLEENAPNSPRVPPVDRGRYDEIIQEYASLYEVEPALVKAVIEAESSFDRHAVSPRGARGLMQLMPRTARHYGVRNLSDPRENIRGGVRHLRSLMKRYRNNLSFVLAAYNAGTAHVERYRGIPPFRQTRTYVSRVMRFRQKYLTEEGMGQALASRM